MHARLAIDVRSCGAQSMLLPGHGAFFECVSFSLCLFPLFISRFSGGHWQVKIARPVPFKAVGASKPSLCRVHSCGYLKLRLLWCLPSFVLPCGGCRLCVRPITAAPLVCASILVATHRAPARPLSPASQLHAQPRLVASCRFAPARCLTIRAGPRRLVLQLWLFLNPASKLDAGGYHGVSRPQPPSISPTRPTPTHLACTTWVSLAVTAHLALSYRHTLSGPVSSPRCASLFIPSTVYYPEPAIDSLCFPARSRSSGMAASWPQNKFKLISLDPNTTIWTLYQSSLPTWVFGPAPTWTNYPRQSLDVGAITNVGLIPFTTFWESAVRIDIWLS